MHASAHSVTPSWGCWTPRVYVASDEMRRWPGTGHLSGVRLPFVVAMPCRLKLEGRMFHAHLKVLPDAVLELIEKLVAVSVTETAVLQHHRGR